MYDRFRHTSLQWELVFPEAIANNISEVHYQTHYKKLFGVGIIVMLLSFELYEQSDCHDFHNHYSIMEYG